MRKTCFGSGFSPRQQVEDKDDQRYYNQEVNETSSYVQGKAEQPQNQQNRDDRSEH